MVKPSANPRIKLIVPAIVAERFEQECRFLGIGDSVYRHEEGEIKSKADMIRWMVSLLIKYWEDGGELPELNDEGDSAYLPFYMASQDRGIWDYAISQHLASDYSALASLAIARYFDQLDNKTEQDTETYLALQRLSQEQLFKTLKSGHISHVQAS